MIMNGARMASPPAPRRRHLLGCYADLDGVEPAVAVAGREQQEGKDRT